MLAMREITTVSERGQTAIPASLRRAHQVRAGCELIWESVAADEWRVRIQRMDRPAPDPMKMVGFAKTFRAPRRTAAWMKELRDGETG